MPIDPSIALGVQQPTQVDPLASLAKVMQLRNLQQQGDAFAQEGQLRGQRIEEGTLDIAVKQRADAGRTALTTALKDPTNRGADGQIDHQKVAAQLSGSFPDVAEAWLTQATKNADALDKLKSTQRAHAEAAQEAIGSLAASAANAREFEASLGLLASSGVIDEPTATKYAQEAEQAGPEGWKAIRDQYVHLAPSQRKAAMDAQTELSKPRDLAPGHAFGVPGQTPAMTTPAKKAFQSKSVLLDGKPAEVNFDPEMGAYSQGGQAIEPSRVKPIPSAAQTVINNRNALPPGNWDKTGDEFLASVPAQWRATVKKIANYDEDPTKVASMRGGMRETLMQWVNQVNPEYDASMYSNRAPTRKAFTTGTQGQQINAINTAIGHIDQLTTLADKMSMSSFVPGNAVFNTVRTMFGSDQVTNFDTLKDALAGEVSSVLSKGGATVSGIAEAKDKIKAASSPKQLAGYVQTLIPVMGSKLASLDYQYHQAMGEKDAFSALSPEVKGILEKHGFDPKHPTIGAEGKTPKGPPDGTEGMVNGKPAVWKTVEGITGWYAK